MHIDGLGVNRGNVAYLRLGSSAREHPDRVWPFAERTSGDGG